MLRLGCVGDLLRFEKREIEVAAFAPDRSSPQSNRGDEAERTGLGRGRRRRSDPTLDLGVQALEGCSWCVAWPSGARGTRRTGWRP